MLNSDKVNFGFGKITLLLFLIFSIGVWTGNMYAATSLRIDGTEDSYIRGAVGIGTTTIRGKLNIGGQYGSDVKEKGDCNGTVDIDWNEGNTQHITLTGNITTLNFNNGVVGRRYTLILKQGGSGGYTVSWPATVRWSGGNAPILTVTVGKTDYIGFIYNSVDSKYDGIAQILNFGD
jgi:hypothetical protein